MSVLAAMIIAAATAGEPPRFVALDWSAVPDDVVGRCALQGLGNSLLQRMVEEGYAVVDQVDAGAVVRIAVVDGSFGVRASLGAVSAERSVPFPEPCDASVLLDIGYAVSDCLDEVWAQAPPPTEAVEPGRLQLWLGAEAVIYGTPWAVADFAADVRWLPSGMPVAVGGVVAVGLSGGGGLFVAEPRLAARGMWRMEAASLELGAGLELGLVSHLFSIEGQGGGRVDARFGVSLEAALPDWPIRATLSAYGRSARIAHQIQVGSGSEVTEEDIYASEVWGIGLGLAWRALAL